MKKISKTIMVISILFSLFLLFGYEISGTGVIDGLFSSKRILLTIVLFILFSFIFYVGIYYLFKLITFLSNKEWKPFKLSLFEKHPFLCLFGLFLVLGIPILIIYYPGTVQWDGMRQLDYFFDIIPWSNHHPVFPTVLMGLAMKLGRFLVNDNFGIFIFTFSQYLISCAVFAYALTFMKKIGTPKPILILSFLFLINPIFYVNAYTLVKDTMFYLMFIMYFIYLVKFYHENSKKNLVLLMVFAILLILFRNNGFYVVLLTFLIMGLFYKTTRKMMAFLLMVTVVFQVSLNKTIEFLGVLPGSVHEMLSVPIQQTARYVKYYDVTEEEKEIIESSFNKSIEEIKERYRPEISDPMKAKFIPDKDYFKLWFKQLFKHPKVYVDAYLENYYGYFYPFKREYKDGLAQFKIVKSKTVNKGNFDIYHLKQYKNNRKSLEDTLYELRDIKGLELIFNVGTYNWIFILMIGYAIYKRRYKYVLFATPIILVLMVCCVSPVNAYIRYALPIITVLPVYIGVITANVKKISEDN